MLCETIFVSSANIHSLHLLLGSCVTATYTKLDEASSTSLARNAHISNSVSSLEMPPEAISAIRSVSHDLGFLVQ